MVFSIHAVGLKCQLHHRMHWGGIINGHQLANTVTPQGGLQYRRPFSISSITAISSVVSVMLAAPKLLLMREGVID